MSEFERHETWKPGIKITDLKPGDIIYINKEESGYSKYYECEFVSFAKGIVAAKVIRCQQRWVKNDPGDIMTARLTKCYLWGKNINDRWAYCHWFKKDGEAK